MMIQQNTVLLCWVTREIGHQLSYKWTCLIFLVNESMGKYCAVYSYYQSIYFAFLIHWNSGWIVSTRIEITLVYFPTSSPFGLNTALVFFNFSLPLIFSAMEPDIKTKHLNLKTGSELYINRCHCQKVFNISVKVGKYWTYRFTSGR